MCSILIVKTTNHRATFPKMLWPPPFENDTRTPPPRFGVALKKKTENTKLKISSCCGMFHSVRLTHTTVVRDPVGSSCATSFSACKSSRTIRTQPSAPKTLIYQTRCFCRMPGNYCGRVVICRALSVASFCKIQQNCRVRDKRARVSDKIGVLYLHRFRPCWKVKPVPNRTKSEK